MAVFTLLDPLRVTISSLFVAVGRPGQIVRVRALQVAALVVGLFVLGSRWGILGVAVVVDGVLLLGLGWLLARARAYVDYSARRLFLAPLLALAAGSAAALGGQWLICRAGPAVCPNDWLTGALKGLLFAALFASTLWVLERRAAVEMLSQLRDLRQPRP